MRLNQKQLIFVLLFFFSAHSGLFAMRTEKSHDAIRKAHSKPQHEISLEILKDYLTFSGSEKVFHVECGDGSIEKVILPDSGTYDVVLSLLGFQYIQDKEQAVAQIFKHLRPGGTMLIALITLIPDHRGIYCAREESNKLGLSLSGNGGYGANGYKNMLLNLGFENVIAELKNFDLYFSSRSEFKSWLKARGKLHEIGELDSSQEELIDKFVTCYIGNNNFDGTISYSLPVIIIKATKP